MNKKKHIWGILVTEEGSREEAEKTAESMKQCPYLIALGTTQNTVYSVYMVPEGKKWWLEYPEILNEKLETEKYSVQIVENPLYPSKFVLKSPRRKNPPCGANCGTCKLKAEYDCDGCPALIP